MLRTRCLIKVAQVKAMRGDPCWKAEGSESELQRCDARCRIGNRLKKDLLSAAITAALRFLAQPQNKKNVLSLKLAGGCPSVRLITGSPLRTSFPHRCPPCSARLWTHGARAALLLAPVREIICLPPRGEQPIRHTVAGGNRHRSDAGSSWRDNAQNLPPEHVHSPIQPTHHRAHPIKATTVVDWHILKVHNAS